MFLKPTRALLAVCLLLVGGLAHADVAIPPVARVTDLTDTLSAQQQQALSQKLAAFEQEKGSQVAVLMVPTTQPETIEQYGIRVAEQWKLGRKGVDDGLILLVAKNDHKVRIEVGYGLEGAVPDAIANRIIDEIILPRFKQGDFYGGINAGVDAILKVVQGEPLPKPKAQPHRSSAGNNLMSIAFPIFFVLIFLGNQLRRLFGGPWAAAGVGVGTGVLMSLLAASLLSGLVFGVIAGVLALLFYSGGSGGGRGGGIGGMGAAGLMGYGLGGGFGGGGLGGGGFGGGGFGGGGGGFGGGGASGGW